ncbi:MAG: hypothetical protein RLZZ324_724 [Candidatus Parcubacteria bacterium]|jgi:hypothetical protein
MAFAAFLEDTRFSLALSCPSPELEQRMDLVTGPVFDSLAASDWQLCSREEAQRQQVRIRMIYEIAFKVRRIKGDAPIRSIVFHTDEEIVPRLAVPRALAANDNDRSSLRLRVGQDVIDAHDVLLLASRLKAHGISDDSRVSAWQGLGGHQFDAAAHHCMVRSIGPTGASASRMLVAAMVEYAAVARSGATESMKPLELLLASFRIALPVITVRDDKTAILAITKP